MWSAELSRQSVATTSIPDASVHRHPPSPPNTKTPRQTWARAKARACSRALLPRPPICLASVWPACVAQVAAVHAPRARAQVCARHAPPPASCAHACLAPHVAVLPSRAQLRCHNSTSRPRSRARSERSPLAPDPRRRSLLQHFCSPSLPPSTSVAGPA